MRKYEHISPVLRQLHWLPIIQYKALYWCTSADTPPLHCISLTSVYQHFAAVTSCGQLTLIYCTSRGHGQVTVTEVLLYAARQFETVCLLAYVLLTLLQLFVDS